MASSFVVLSWTLREWWLQLCVDSRCRTEFSFTSRFVRCEHAITRSHVQRQEGWRVETHHPSALPAHPGDLICPQAEAYRRSTDTSCESS